MYVLYLSKFFIMFLGTINSVDYYDIESLNKDIIQETSENKVKFVSQDEFDVLIDQVHWKAEFLTYTTSMSSWLMIIISLLLLSSCSTHRKCDTKFFNKFYQEQYGTDNDDCSNQYIDKYGITIYGDTLLVERYYNAKCFYLTHKNNSKMK